MPAKLEPDLDDNDWLRRQLIAFFASKPMGHETYSAYCDAAGVPSSTIRSFLKGDAKTSIQWDTLHKLARFADMTVFQMLRMPEVAIEQRLNRAETARIAGHIFREVQKMLVGEVPIPPSRFGKWLLVVYNQLLRQYGTPDKFPARLPEDFIADVIDASMDDPNKKKSK